MRVDLNKDAKVSMKLLDADGNTITFASQIASPSTMFKELVKNPHKWTAETPYLYQLVLSTSSCATEQRVGFRVSEIKNGVFTVNGKPVKLRGVNRHEHHPDHGRAVPYGFLQNDLLLMKRTQHQCYSNFTPT